MLVVYVLVSQQNPNRHYVGLTRDLDRRLSEHNRAESGYSSRYAPWSIETYVVFKNTELAIEFEKYLKSGSGHAFLKKRLMRSVRRPVE